MKHTLEIAALTVCAILQAGGAAPTETNMMTEVALQTRKQYANPFMDVELDVLFTGPDGTEMKVPAFWAGDGTWKVRYARARSNAKAGLVLRFQDPGSLLSMKPKRGHRE